MTTEARAVASAVIVEVGDVRDTDAKSFGNFVESFDRRVAIASFYARNVSLAQAGSNTQLFLSQVGLQSQLFETLAKFLCG